MWFIYSLLCLCIVPTRKSFLHSSGLSKLWLSQLLYFFANPPTVFVFPKVLGRQSARAVGSGPQTTGAGSPRPPAWLMRIFWFQIRHSYIFVYTYLLYKIFIVYIKSIFLLAIDSRRSFQKEIWKKCQEELTKNTYQFVTIKKCQQSLSVGTWELLR